MKRLYRVLIVTVSLFLLFVIAIIYFFSDIGLPKGFDRAKYEFYSYMLDNKIDPDLFMLDDSSGTIVETITDIKQEREDWAINRDNNPIIRRVYKWRTVTNSDTLVLNVAIGNEVHVYFHGETENWNNLKGSLPIE